MRARQDQAPFADFLLQLGNGLIPQQLEQPFLHSIALPQQCVVNENITDLIFPYNLPLNEYAHRIVVTPTNDTALRLNNSICNDYLAILFIYLVQILSMETIWKILNSIP